MHQGEAPARLQIGASQVMGPTVALHRRALILVFGGVGLALYNWWAPVALQGWLPSINSLFSEISAIGQPHARALQHLDVLSGVLLVAALVLRGPLLMPGPVRVVRTGMLAWAVAAGMGGLFPFACAPSTMADCRHEQWHLHLPAHHYVHMLVGVVEFGGSTLAILAAWRVERLARLAKGLTVVLMAAYPLLAAAYLSDHVGSLVEPIFFVVFSVMAAAVLLA